LESIIEIKRTNLLKKSDYFLLLNYTVCSILGIVSIFWDWQASIGPLIGTILVVVLAILFSVILLKVTNRSYHHTKND